MLRFFVSHFNKNVSYGIVETKEPSRDTNTIIYRDELSKNHHKKAPANHKSRYGDVCFATSKPKINNKNNNMQRRSYGSSGVEEKGVIRVKVLMTKHEAARLLGKCKEGGVLGFEDAANELVKIPVNRVSVAVVSPPCNTSTCGGEALKSIPEEF